VENILRITGYVINTHEQRNASAGLLGILALAILNFSFGHSPQIQRARYADSLASSLHIHFFSQAHTKEIPDSKHAKH